MHKHKCGFWSGVDPFEYILTPVSARPRGCGYEWEHEDASQARDIGEEASIAAHTCPNCHAGPWGLQYRPETVAALASLDAIMQQRGSG